MNYIGKYITKNPQLPSPTAAPGIWNLDDALQYQKAGIWPPGYQISRSVRLRASASATLSKTFASAGNRKTFTFSCWVKIEQFTTNPYIFASGGTSTPEFICSFDGADALNIGYFNGASYTYRLLTSQVFRDPSAWYHIVVAWDTTQATAANRIKLYVNGVQVTAFSTASYPSQNYDAQYINTTSAQYIGSSGSTRYFDGYLTEINFIDGQALTPASFGYTDTVSGVWQPLPYTGTYGANGFYLNFSDNSAATAAAIGKDYSGNGNNWTPNNISVTAGTTYDSMVDSPTQSANGDTGVGGEVRGNYPVINPIAGAASGSSYTITQANLYAVLSSAANVIEVPATMALPTSGKWYWEVNVVSVNTTYSFPLAIGISDQGGIGTASSFTNNYYYYISKSGNKYSNGTSTAYGATFTANDVIGVAFDATNGTLTFYKGSASQGTAYTGLTAGPYYPKFGSTDGSTFVANFGQRAFANTAPSGYKALCSTNLPTPTINNGAKYMAATLYTGTSLSQTIANTSNNFSFQPDFVWIKSRSAATNNELTDSVRGATKALVSNSTAAESTDTNGLTAFGSTGFTVGTDTNYNNNAATYVAWQWLAGAGTTSNIAVGSVSSGVPSIASTVSVNTTAGFSIVTYTGTGANATVGHGLGVAPQMVIIKNRSGANGWTTYQAFQNASPASGYVQLNSTAAFTTFSLVFNNTAPTSSVFSVGTDTSTNASTNNYVAYCFAPIAGYSAFGSYTGNGSTDGPFVYLGFRPRWVLMKSSTLVTNWWIIDTSRNTYNVANTLLTPSNTYADDSTYNVMDVTSNGFKIRTTYTGVNSSGDTYIYAAFAENPFKYARAR